jgi:type IV secretion system protein VirB10
MTAVSTSGSSTESRPKEPAPGLFTRAPRPAVIRLRKSVVQAAGFSAALLVGGSLAWAFVVQPHLRAEAHPTVDDANGARGAVRPADIVAKQPASYDRLASDQLPPPRTLGNEAPAAPAKPATAEPPAAQDGPRNVAHQALQSGLFFASNGASGGGAAAASPGGAVSATRSDYGAVYNTHQLLAPLSPYELKAGAVVPATLLTAVDTSRTGPVVASVTENVFDSVSGRYLLVPQGTRLIGRHNGDTSYGDHRAYLTWDRLILPNGKSLILTEEQGVDAQGAVGVRGSVDRRIVPLAIATLFAGAITTLGTIARDDNHHGSGGIIGDVGDATAITAAQVGGRLIDRELQVHPSIKLGAGAPVRVLITRDLVLEPYQP